MGMPPAPEFSVTSAVAPRKWRWVWRIALGLLLALLLATLAAWALLRASLAQLDGRLTLPGLSSAMSIGRDARGTVVLEGATREDLARGLGFVHAQDRFFEMDLTRRSAAGELSELFGDKALERDVQRRQHRMRARLQQRLESLSASETALLRAYTEGVNAGLQALPARPWAYWLLGQTPQPWQPVDSALVVAEMFFTLQARHYEQVFERAWLREQAGDALLDFFHPQGGRWDATLDGVTPKAAPLPGPELLDLRRARATELTAQALNAEPPPLYGSNNWAVAGTRSRHGGALLADDMHLKLSVPGLWYRAQLQLGSGAQALRAAGVTLPGLPALVVGSNGHIAWGFTNAGGQWFEWLEVDPKATLTQHEETIRVKGQAPHPITVREYQGAPLLRREGQREFALRWVAHAGEAFNLALDELLQARSIDEATDIARRAGMPHQNFMVADRQGQIAWTLSGRLWQPRSGADRYAHFLNADAPPPAWLPASQVPLIRQPASGQLWTANSRQLGGAGSELIGAGAFDLGARTQQIRDRLSERPLHDEASMAALQLDDEARFMKSWAQRLLPLLQQSPAHREAATLLQQWNGRADADSAAYWLLRLTRQKTLNLLWTQWSAPFVPTKPNKSEQAAAWPATFEYSAAAALDQRPAHLLPAGFKSWEALLLAQLDAAVADITQQSGSLAQARWGEHNRSQLQHPLSKSLPLIGTLLNMPSKAQGGDGHLPHVSAPAFGQSQRLVVSPGREELAILALPGGQSGHPLSRFWGASQPDWAAQRPTPLLAGELRHRITAAP
ncbi:penicillin acylase family protein [Roseateles sp. BYS180W]|uniref:Penicillin acylase family protein n=1 Tax=Roseateles rivi TaxID=3299028 RepID=A0ABW7FYI7_9BURK